MCPTIVFLATSNIGFPLQFRPCTTSLHTAGLACCCTAACVGSRCIFQFKMYSVLQAQCNPVAFDPGAVTFGCQTAAAPAAAPAPPAAAACGSAGRSSPPWCACSSRPAHGDALAWVLEASSRGAHRWHTCSNAKGVRCGGSHGHRTPSPQRAAPPAPPAACLRLHLSPQTAPPTALLAAAIAAAIAARAPPAPQPLVPPPLAAHRPPR